MAYQDPAIRRRNDAKRLLQTRGIATPTPAQVSTEQRKLRQEDTFQKAQQSIQQTKEKALTGRTTTRLLGSIQPRLDTISIGGPTPVIAPPRPRDILQVSAGQTGISSAVMEGPRTAMIAGQRITETPLSPLEQQAKEILEHNLGVTGGRTEALGRRTVRSLIDLPQTIGATPGLEKFTISQLGRLQGEEEAGLQSYLGALKTVSKEKTEALKKVEEAKKPGAINEFASKQFGYLVDDKGRPITDTQGKTIDLPAQSDAELGKRRDSARNKFLALREAIGKKGLQLDLGTGERYLKEFETTDNPEKLLNRYMLEAFSVPAVKAAFKKGGGISIKIPGFFKELEYVGNLSDEQIENFKDASGILKEIKGTGIINPFED